MHRQYFFGYGSLVNLRTHSYPDTRRAELQGWRRTWCHTRLRDEAFLSVHAAPADTILGLVAEVPNRDWRALDLREDGYDRHGVSDRVRHDLAPATDVQIYAVPDRHRRGDPAAGHVLMSYLDVVVQGFLHQYGREGAAHFFDTTDGWDLTVIDDRATPLYPRHQILTPAERAEVDGHLDRLGVAVRPSRTAF